MKYLYNVLDGALDEFAYLEDEKNNHIYLADGKVEISSDSSKTEVLEQFAAMMRPVELNKYIFDASCCCPYCYKKECECSISDISAEFEAK